MKAFIFSAVPLLLLPLVMKDALPEKSMSPQETPNQPVPLTVKCLQFFALTEGISFLLLLFVAMPLKYIGGNESWVHFLGPIHGGLFLLYVLAVFVAIPALRWSPLRILMALVASSVPFGTLFVDAQLRREHGAKRTK